MTKTYRKKALSLIYKHQGRNVMASVQHMMRKNLKNYGDELIEIIGKGNTATVKVWNGSSWAYFGYKGGYGEDY